MRVHILRGECLVCGVRLLSPAAAVPVGRLQTVRKQPPKGRSVKG